MYDMKALYQAESVQDAVALRVAHPDAQIIAGGSDVLVQMREGKRAGVVLKPKTPAETVLPFLNEVELVLVMTVEPGFGGQAFLEHQLDTIRRVRAFIDQYNPACDLEVDGGINPVTAKKVVEAGANVLVAGSAVYGAPDISLAIASLRGEA